MGSSQAASQLLSGAGDEFLAGLPTAPWSVPSEFPKSLKPIGCFAQQVGSGLEVVVAAARSRPRASDMRKAHSVRRAGRASPVLVVALHPGSVGTSVSMCGPAGDAPPVWNDLDPSQAECIVRLALQEPNRHAAVRFLASALPEMSSPLPGLRNMGLLATHELSTGVPQRPDWDDAVRRSQPLLTVQGAKLVRRLGFGMDASGANASLLTVNGSGRAVAVFCDATEPVDAGAARFDGASPVSYALATADRHNLDWVLLTRASEIRLYAARPDTGVGRKGRAETFIEANLALLPAEQAGYLHLLFSAEALAADGTIEEILGESERFSVELALRLRDRVYLNTVPALAAALAERVAPEPSPEELEAAYEQVMIILFRLLFIAYAEDKDLLPYRSNSLYEAQSLKRFAIETAQKYRDGTPPNYSSASTGLWDRINKLWVAVGRGPAAVGGSRLQRRPVRGGRISQRRGCSPGGPEPQRRRARPSVGIAADRRRPRRCGAPWTSVHCQCASSAPSMKGCWNRSWRSPATT